MQVVKKGLQAADTGLGQQRVPLQETEQPERWDSKPHLAVVPQMVSQVLPDVIPEH